MYGVSVFLHTTKGEEEEYENGGKEGGLITKTGGNTKAPALRMGPSNATTHEKKSLESDLGMLGNKSLADYWNRGGEMLLGEKMDYLIVTQCSEGFVHNLRSRAGYRNVRYRGEDAQKPSPECLD